MRGPTDDPRSSPRRRLGCLGKLLGLAAIAIVGFCVTGVFAYVVAPWNFNFGGHFHPFWTQHPNTRPRLIRKVDG